MVATQPKTRGSVMMAVGVLMVIFAVITMLINSDPLPMPMVIIGLVFVAIGSRQRRMNT